MKTPREFLLKRHESADPQLDRLRRKTLSAEFSAKTRHEAMQALPLRALLKVWQELIWPSRRTWAAVMVAWLGIWWANAAMSEPSATPPAGAHASAPALLQAWEEQQRWLAELAPVVVGQPAELPVLPPGPRSEWFAEIRKV